MSNSPQQKQTGPKVSVSCTHCAHRFAAPTVELDLSQKITCPVCKKKFTPIFSEGTEQKGR
jgi:uncharacterized paraquat-inducible protein A